MGNGNKIRFWKDNFIPMLGPLQNHSQGSIPSWQIDLPAASFATNGAWNWDMFSDHISPDGLAALASVMPPDLNAESDSVAWKFSSSGEFTFKSAYNYLMGIPDKNQLSDHVFKKIWSWQGPPRISSFIWKLYHGRLLTNSERMRRGMSSNDICPRCGNSSENIMHTLRDCDDIKELWESLIDPNEWASFFSMGLHQWVKKNLLDFSFSATDTPWSFVYPTAVWLIWKDRNDLIFNKKTELPGNLFFHIISYARRVISSIAAPWPISQRIYKNEILVNWTCPPKGFYKLNIDGSVLNHSCDASCGEIIRDDAGDFVEGFICNLGVSSSVKAELWGILHGLKLAVRKKIKNLIINTDSKDSRGVSFPRQSSTTTSNVEDLIPSIPCHAIFVFLDPILLGVLQVDYQNKKESPFDTHQLQMQTFLTAISIYSALLGTKIHTQHLNQVLSYGLLLSGALSSASLLSILLQRQLLWIVLFIWGSIPLILARDHLLKSEIMFRVIEMRVKFTCGIRNCICRRDLNIPQ
ncbi:Ribonuclease H-like superfamily [Sesbania bispinosa]|nr:Ribonuclease H-like superfamily [Sesbania bispinosa]